MMKRSGSRASKISMDAQEYSENSLPGIPDAKWHEFLKKEDTGIFILGLREEIIQKTMDICFENYLEKQAVAFTVHCAYLAWCKTLDMFYMFRDPGDTDDPKVKESWEPDPEPEPSIIDSWGSKCIVPIDPEKPVPKKEKEIPKTVSDPTIQKTESLTSCSFAYDLFDTGEGEFYFCSSSSKTSSESKVIRKGSIFTKTLSMCRDLLPLVQVSPFVDGVCQDETVAKKEKSTIKKRL